MSGPAIADTPTQDEARAAYDRAAEAYDRGAYAPAAADFARADALVPNDVALELALRSVLRIDDPVLGMTLVERAHARGAASSSIRELSAQVEARYTMRVGRLRIVCAKDAACSALVDRVPFPIGAPTWVLAGDHAAEIASGKAVEHTTARVVAGGETTLRSTLPPPVPAAPSPPSDRRSLSPAWFWIGAGLTATVGGFTLASAIDTQQRHDAFETTPDDAHSSAGRASQTRTDVLALVTVVAALATTGVGLFGVSWSRPQP